ncbi:MAG TPA: TadE family protein [Methylobacter sp.]|jgi:Flp pilus assembly protein TadG
MNTLPVNIDRRRQRGLAMVEMVIVVPILLLLMLGAAELGRALFQYNTLTKAVRDGARYFSANTFVGGGTQVDTTASANTVNLVIYGQIGSGGTPLLPSPLPTVSPPVISTSGGITWVTVTASYQFQFLPGNPLSGIMGLFGSSLTNPLTLNASTTMRAL